MSNKFAKVENYPHLVRDMNTSAIINTDKKSLDEYNRNKKTKQREREKIASMENEIMQIKNTLDELKTLILSINHG